MSVRPAVAEDRTHIGHIAYNTGYFGRSAKIFMPNEALFAELWVGAYLDGAGCCNFVAEADGQLIGYVVGTCDLRRYQRHMLRLLPRLALRLMRGAYPGWRAGLPFLLRQLRYPSRSAPAVEFPAQLHINLLSTERGEGWGRQLLEVYLSCLQQRHVVGVQLSTTRENEAAVHLYQELGFEIWREYESPLWRPWLGRNARHLVMTKRL